MPKTSKWDFHHVDVGTGDTIVLLHGLAGDHRAWTPQIEPLKQKYRVVALDNPGSGKSSRVTAPTTLAEIGTAMLDFLSERGVSRFHLVGRSMGGGIAQEMALAAPDRVKSLVLAGSFAKLDRLGIRLIENMRDFIKSDPNWTRWTRLFSFAFVSTDYFLADESRMTRLEGIIADETRDVPSYVNLANACLAYQSIGRLRNVKCPLLVLAGRKDPICSPMTTPTCASTFGGSSSRTGSSSSSVTGRPPSPPPSPPPRARTPRSLRPTRRASGLDKGSCRSETMSQKNGARMRTKRRESRRHATGTSCPWSTVATEGF